MAALPVCTVCKRHKDWYDERDEQMRAAATESKGQEEDEDGELFIIPERKAKPDWSETSSRLAVSQVQIIFKLYEVLKREFLVGYICTDCLTLLEQVDSLQFQLHAVTKALKDRIDSHCGYKKRSDVIDAREGYRARFKALTAKKAALIDAEREDARLEQVADEDLPLINERAPMKRQIEEEEEDEEEEVGVVKPEEERNNGQMNSYEPTETYDSEMSNGKIVFNLNMSFWSNISDADYLHKVLAKQNFDHEFTIFAASRAQENLLYDGNLWKRDQNHKLKKTAKIVTAWFCSKRFLKTNAGRSDLRQGTGCLARLATLADDSKVVLDSIEIEHNHPPNSAEVKQETFKCKLREIVVNDPTMDPNQVVATAEILYGKDYSSTYKKMVDFVSKIQKNLGVPKRIKNPTKVPTFKKPRFTGDLELQPSSFHMNYDDNVESIPTT